MLLRAVGIWIVIALAEMLQGILRVKLANRWVGDRRARRWGVLSGSMLILLIAWVSLPWIGPESGVDSLLVGAIWLALMVGFDVLFGRLVFRFSWRRIAADFDVRKGNLLAVGMLVLFLTPWVVCKLRGLF